MKDLASLLSEILEGKGYVLIPGVLSLEQAEEARSLVLKIAGQEKPQGKLLTKISQKVTGKAGSVIISHGLCWHDTSVNSAEKPRVSILGNYAPKFVRPLENPFRDMQQKVLDRATPKLKQLLGYKFKSALYNDIKRIRSGNWN